MSASRPHVGLMIVAGLLSLLLWAVVRTQEAPAKTPGFYAARLIPQGLPNDEWAITQIESTIPLRLSATEAQIRSIDPNTLYAIVNLSDPRTGRRSYPVEVFPDSVRAMLADRNLSVQVEVERRVTRGFDVTPDTRGELADTGFVVDRLIASPTRVEVSGPQSRVDQIVQVRARLDLGQVRASARQGTLVSLEAVGDQERPIADVRLEPSFVRVQPVLVPAPERKLVVLDPQLVGTPADGFMVAGVETIPSRLQVTGKSLALAKVSALPTSPIDLTGLSEDKEVEVQVTLPQGVRLANPGAVKVRLRIKPIRPVNAAPAEPGSP